MYYNFDYLFFRKYMFSSEMIILVSKEYRKEIINIILRIFLKRFFFSYNQIECLFSIKFLLIKTKNRNHMASKFRVTARFFMSHSFG